MSNNNEQERFELQPPKPARKRARFENNDASRQCVLFVGANDKRGQQYLFGTEVEPCER